MNEWVTIKTESIKLRQKKSLKAVWILFSFGARDKNILNLIRDIQIKIVSTDSLHNTTKKKIERVESEEKISSVDFFALSSAKQNENHFELRN